MVYILPSTPLSATDQVSPNRASVPYTISRVAFGTPNSQVYTVVGPQAQASFDITKPAEFMYDDAHADFDTRGQRRVLIGDQTPLYSNSCAMDAPGVGWNYNDNFVIQARAFLEQVNQTPSDLPAGANFQDGLHTMSIIHAIAESAERNGEEIRID